MEGSPAPSEEPVHYRCQADEGAQSKNGDAVEDLQTQERAQELHGTAIENGTGRACIFLATSDLNDLARHP